MTNELSLLNGLRRHFIRNVVTPMILVVLFTFLACGFTAWWVTTVSNTKRVGKTAAGHQQYFCSASG